MICAACGSPIPVEGFCGQRDNGVIGACTPSETNEEIMRAALTLIAQQRPMTLIAPSGGFDFDRGHQEGAHKAFEQMADIAESALVKATGEKP